MALLVVTLVANVVLGIELYTALHPGSTAFSGKNVNTETVQQTSTVSPTETNSSTYPFSFKFTYVFHFKEEGYYVVGINPNASAFKSLFVIVQFKNGKTVELTLYNTSAIVHLEKEDKVATVFVTGVSYLNLTSRDVMNYVNLYYQEVSSPSSSSSESD